MRQYFHSVPAKENTQNKTTGKKSGKERKYDSPWEKLFEKFIDPTTPVCLITADEIKKETGLEPRLMAKFDSRENLPPVFVKNNRFLLPVTNGQYAVISGDGYHDIEEKKSGTTEYESHLPFNLQSLGIGSSEMQYIDYAFNSGLISHFTGIHQLYPTIRGRKRSPRFSFKANGIPLPSVESVQVEIDAGYEAEKEILIIEAKVGRPKSFIIRQLFYPYRFWKTVVPDKKIRTVFMFFDPDISSYEFHEYIFEDDNEYSSIKPHKSAAYRLTTDTGNKLETLENLLKETPVMTSQKHNWIIPQANDINKIIELPFRVAEGLNRSAEIAEYFGFTTRQSSYYREAAEALDLVRLDEGNIYALTDAGRRFITLPIEKRNRLLCKQMMELPIIKEILSNLYEKKTLTFAEVAAIIANKTKLTGKTPARRASCLKNWFYWLYSATGMIKVSTNRLFL